MADGMLEFRGIPAESVQNYVTAIADMRADFARITGVCFEMLLEEHPLPAIAQPIEAEHG